MPSQDDTERFGYDEDTERFDPAVAPASAGHQLVASWSAGSEVTCIAWDHRGHTVTVLRADGDLRVWDVRDWRTEHVIDPRRELIARTPEVGGLSQWTFGTELVSIAFTRDDGRLIVSDPGGATSLLTRAGERIWRHAFAPDSSWPTGWRWLTASQRDEDASIEVRVVWSLHRGFEPDGTPLIDDRTTVTTLDPIDGHVITHRDEPAPPWAPMKPGVQPRIRLVRRAGGSEVRVGDEVLLVPAHLGTASGVFPSPDERTLLVATTSGCLLRFDRV